MNLITVSQILFILGFICWLFPPFKQFGGNYFYFFLILALMDPIALLLRPIKAQFLLHPLYLTGSFLLFVSLFEKKELKKYFIVFLLGLILINIFSNSTDLQIYHGSLLVVHLLILIIFLQRMIVDYVGSNRIQGFLLILIFYELTTILKFFNFMLGFTNAAGFYIITSIAQIAFGLYFSIIRENKQEPVS